MDNNGILLQNIFHANELSLVKFTLVLPPSSAVYPLVLTVYSSLYVFILYPTILIVYPLLLTICLKHFHITCGSFYFSSSYLLSQDVVFMCSS